MTFRDRLVATLRACEPVLEIPGVLVAGSEVPNLLQPGSESMQPVDGMPHPDRGRDRVARVQAALEGIS